MTRKSSALLFVVGVLGLLVDASSAAGGPAVTDDHFKVDQFGYRPGDRKVAVVSDPVNGFNAPDPYTPPALLEIRRYSDDTLAMTAAAVTWNGGGLHSQSGDRAYWVDFSGLTETGDFYLYDPVQAVGSYRFRIAEDVHRTVLTQALRSFYYQRCGTAKATPFAAASWADTSCHVGPEQDRDSRSVLDTSPSTTRDLAGGWHDAGDYNKYVNFADGVVHDLLYAYEANPLVWGDGNGIPESGNCLPDIIEEIEWELDWFLAMQSPDGSVLHKVSVTDFAAASPPSADAAFRRYARSTASATVSATGAFAHAATVFRTVGDPGLDAYAARIEAAAREGWAWLDANPGRFPSTYDNAGFQNAAAEEGAYEQETNRLCSAIYLFELTGDPLYGDYVTRNYASAHLLQWTHAYPFESEYQDCLLRYTRLPGANPNAVTAIEDAYRASVRSHLDPHLGGVDAYRAYLADGDYTWGSNRTKAQHALMFLSQIRYGLDPANNADYRDAAAGYLHYLHGVNPLGMVYLTNMNAFGAERSANEIYHSWYFDGTDWDSAATSLHGPAPGFVPGGVNPFFAPDPSYSGPPLEPPQNQPTQKSYLDWNTSWPENSWEVTENSITYQAAYIRLLGELSAETGALAPPGSPGNGLRAVRVRGDVTLSWSATTNATSYGLTRCDATVGACVPAPHLTGSGLAITDTPNAGIDYWYRLRAVNGCGATD